MMAVDNWYRRMHNTSQKVTLVSFTRSTGSSSLLHASQPMLLRCKAFSVLQYSHMLIVYRPIFTHEGRGLVNKNKDEFVSIREVDFKHSAAGPESKHGTLWADRFADIKANGAYSSWHSMANNTSVHLTSAQTHKYKTRCTISGQLEPTSISYLQTLFTQSVLAKFPVGRSLQSEADDRFDTSNFRTHDHLKRTQSHNRKAPTGSQTLTPNGWGGSTTSRGGNSDMYRPSKLRC
jgi:hypothetical protein